MATGRDDFEGAFGGDLSPHFDQIGIFEDRFPQTGNVPLERTGRGERLADLQQRFSGMNRSLRIASGLA